MNNLIKNIIAETKSNYNILASHFSYTRSSLWPELKNFAKRVNRKAKVLDLGCGNGRLFELLKEKDIDYLGIDFSEKLIPEAKNRFPKAKFKVADITQEKTWPDLINRFDFIFCIAVLHHLPSKKLKKRTVQYIKQSLKPGGKVFVTVWNLWQAKYLRHHLSVQSIKLKWQLKNLKVLYFPYKLNQSRGEAKIINRFVYPFTLEELKKLFQDYFVIEKLYSSGKNLCLVGRKKI